MTLRNLLVSYNGTPAADAALAHAVDLASRAGAHLTGILSWGPQELIASYATYLPAGMAEQLVAADRKRRGEIEARYRAHAAAIPADRLHFEDVFSTADEGLMAVSRAFDLIVMGNPDPESEIPHMEPHPDVVARHSGRPVVIVPRSFRAETTPSNHALVAWDGGRAAARAMTDAMQLLEMRKSVTLLTVGDPREAPRLDGITAHLQRHGLAVTALQKPKDGRRIAEIILDECAETGAGLLVMGAYEHSKFAEDLFGGVTNTVLAASHIPVLMSH